MTFRSSFTLLAILATPASAETPEHERYAAWPGEPAITCDNLVLSEHVQLTANGLEQAVISEIDGQVVFFALPQAGDEEVYTRAGALNTEGEWVIVNDPSTDQTEQMGKFAVLAHNGPSAERLGECGRAMLTHAIEDMVDSMSDMFSIGD